MRAANYFVSFLLLILATGKLAAQAYYDDTRYDGYISAYLYENYITYKPVHGTFTVKFPYTLTDRTTGARMTTNFFASKENLPGTSRFTTPGICGEVGKGHLTIDGSYGFYVHTWSDNLSFDINYRFILRRFPVREREYASRSFPNRHFEETLWNFPVKISLGIFYWQPLWELGQIDIADKQFEAAGQTFQAIDSGLVNNAGHVTVYYHQNIVAFTPNFSIGWRPINGRLDVAFRVCPLITLTERGGLRFKLNNTGAVDWRPSNGISVDGLIPLNSYNVDATFNGEQISSTPFHLKCVMFTFRVGLRLW